MKKSRKMPPGFGDVPGAEDAVLWRVRWVAYLLDNSILIPGTKFRFGLDALMGLLPAAGDFLAALISGYIIFEAWRAHLPGRVIVHMFLNILVDMIIGIVPIFGDSIDAVWKANSRNAALFEKHYLRSQTGDFKRTA